MRTGETRIDLYNVLLYFNLMTFSFEETYVRSMFYETLRGEFKPSCDAEKRGHNLAKLTVATFMKGINLPSLSVIGQVGYLYSPSWAPNVRSRAICLENSDGNSINLSRLIIENELEELTFQDQLYSSDSEEIGLAIVSNGEKIVELPLSPGRDIEIAKIAVTSSVQSFFDRLDN